MNKQIAVKTREKWVDDVKVIACILVVLGHFFQSMTKANILPENDLYKWFNTTIYYFHVPLFFICSGYLYQKYSKVNSVDGWYRNVAKKALALGVPYVTFSTATWVLKKAFSGNVNNQIGGLGDGMKNFVLYSVPKLVTEKLHIPLILGPQTYGPFKSKMAENLAKRMLKKTDYIFARDDESAQQVARLIQKKRVCMTSDLAMELPYDKELSNREHSNNTELDIGINVSNLLWHDGKDFGFSLDYVQFTKQLIEKLSQKYRVHLIAHTYDKNDGEYRIAEELHRLYPKTILARTFVSPIDAKNYISKMDFFIGARMHATIGAFSSGVPIAPIAYSRKFSGLYGSIGYPYIIDCTILDESEATNKVLEMIENIETYKEKQSDALKKAIQLNRQYRSFLRKKLSK